jgi:hypothetical protein
MLRERPWSAPDVYVREKIELSFRHPVMMRGATVVSNRQ